VASPFQRALRERQLRQPSGLSLIIAATGVAAAAGYLVIWLVPREIGLDAYYSFGLFWAAMYFVVGTLSGLQQEVARAAAPVSIDRPQRGSARNFAPVFSAAVFATVIVTAPLWVSTVFPTGGWALVLPLAVASSSYALVAVLAGTLYGLSGWWQLAAMIVVDALLRLIAVVAVASVTTDAAALAWAAAVPFLLTLVVLWPGIRRSVVGAAALDVEMRALTWNVARTILAAASIGVLVSGLPVVIGIAAGDTPRALAAALFLAVMITRAPVIVVVMSLQSYLLVKFRDQRGGLAPALWRIEAVVLGGGALLALVAALIGPVVFELLYPGQIELAGWFYAVLVLSSALIGGLIVTGSAVLAVGMHRAYTLGWVVAALVTIGSFALTGDLLTRVVIAVVAGPVAGSAVQLGFLLARYRRGLRLG